MSLDIFVLGSGRHKLLSDGAKLQMSEKDSDGDGSWSQGRERDYAADKDLGAMTG